MRKFIAIALLFFTIPVHAYWAKDFDDVNDALVFPNEAHYDLDGTSSMTVMCWVYNNAGAGDNGIMMAKQLNSGNFTGIAINARVPSGTLQGFRFFLTNDNSPSNFIAVDASTVSLGAWHHMAMTYNGSEQAANLLIYRDGARDLAQATVTNTLTNSILNDVALRVGSRDADGQPTGLVMADCRIYEVVLTASEIETAYRCINQPVRGLLSQVLMNRDSTSSYSDLGRLGNNPTCTNCPGDSLLAPNTQWCES